MVYKLRNGKNYQQSIQENPGKPLAFVVERDGAPVQLTLTPNTITEEGQTFGQIGVMYQTPFESAPLEAIPNAAIKRMTYCTNF